MVRVYYFTDELVILFECLTLIMAMILGIDTETKWIKEISGIPFIGHIFLFALIFIPAVIMSFILQAIVLALHNDIGFTKAMLLLLPTWNLGLWIGKIRVFIFFVPTWVLFGIISIVKGYLMIKGIDDGQ